MSILIWLLAGASLAKGILMLFSYLNNVVFPQPLSEEAERELLVKARAGDPIAKNRLIEHNLRLVAHVVRKFEGSGEDMEDLISIGTIGLIKAVNTFNDEKGTRLATYAAKCIENDTSITSVKHWRLTSKRLAVTLSIP